MFQNDAVILQIFPKNGGILFQNGQQWRGEDQPLLPPSLCMSKGITKGAEGLATARRDIQPIDTTWMFCKSSASV